MDIEDLVIEKKTYRVEIERILHITEDPLGNYRAESRADLEHALTDGRQSQPVYVRTGVRSKWYQMTNGVTPRKPRKRHHKRKV